MSGLITLIVLGTSIWVLFDTISLGVKKGQVKGLAGMGPLGWFAACLLLWIVAFPLYIIKRGELKRVIQNSGEPAPAKSRISLLVYIGAAVGVVVLFLYINGVMGLSGKRQRLQAQLDRAHQVVITFDEYQQIHSGMSYGEVVDIIGDEGRELSLNRIEGTPGASPAVETVTYQWTNTGGGIMNAIFQNDELIQKEQAGLN